MYFLSVTLRPNADHDFLCLEVSGSHTICHRRQDSSGLVISSSHGPQPDNTLHSKHISIHTTGGIRNSTGEQPQPYGLDRAATETRYYIICRYQIARPLISLD